MKSIILILLITGFLLMMKGYTESYKQCPLPKIEYRYIPRNFYEEQITENNLKSLYSDMFNKSDTWSKYPLGDADVISKVDNNTNFINEDDYDTESEEN
tara:strand:+ start:1256 stop:1552 length:297 start_codon:yes stop_codon:yes gene_type:complete